MGNLTVSTGLICVFFTFCGWCIHYVCVHLYFGYKPQPTALLQLPPQLPYAIPILGSALSYIQNPTRFMNQKIAQISNPIRINMMMKDIYIILGKQHISQLWRYSSLSTSAAMYYFVLTRLFGMPRKAALRITKDNSGSAPQPYPGTHVEPHNRVDFLVYHNLLSWLSGPGLLPFFNRFQVNVSRRLASLNINTEWTSQGDFWELVTLEMSPAIVEAMCGPRLLSQNPEFCRTFFEYNDAVPKLAMGIPKILSRAGHRARNSLLRDIKAWHSWVREHFDETNVSADGDYDPCLGAKFMRDRQKFFLQIDDFDYDALASEDLGAIFAACANSFPIIFWALYHAFRDPLLLQQLRTEVKQAIKKEDNVDNIINSVSAIPNFDEAILSQLPRLQSVYAETLRLYVSIYIVRYTEREEIKLGTWRLPKNKAILVPTSTAHNDRSAWNEGPNGEHRVDTFWAERFLVFPNDPSSGPRKKSFDDDTKRKRLEVQSDALGPQKVKFSLDGMSGSWIPYGGGPRVCPGRHLSKRQIMLMIAMMITAFEVEFDTEQDIPMREDAYGTGIRRPKTRVPFKIRRRSQSEVAV